jgi:hypothetical protein
VGTISLFSYPVSHLFTMDGVPGGYHISLLIPRLTPFHYVRSSWWAPYLSLIPRLAPFHYVRSSWWVPYLSFDSPSHAFSLCTEFLVGAISPSKRLVSVGPLANWAGIGRKVLTRSLRGAYADYGLRLWRNWWPEPSSATLPPPGTIGTSQSITYNVNTIQTLISLVPPKRLKYNEQKNTII